MLSLVWQLVAKSIQIVILRSRCSLRKTDRKEESPCRSFAAKDWDRVYTMQDRYLRVHGLEQEMSFVLGWYATNEAGGWWPTGQNGAWSQW